MVSSQRSAVSGQQSAVSFQRSALSSQHSAVSIQHSAASIQRSAVSTGCQQSHSAVSTQQPAFSNQHSAICGQRSAVSIQHSASASKTNALGTAAITGTTSLFADEVVIYTVSPIESQMSQTGSWLRPCPPCSLLLNSLFEPMPGRGGPRERRAADRAGAWGENSRGNANRMGAPSCQKLRR